MKFIIGVAIGAAGMWAYRAGKLREWIGIAPEPVQQTINRAAQRVGDMAPSERVREFASNVQDQVQGTSPSSIATPSPAEVAGRPEEPLPS